MDNMVKAYKKLLDAGHSKDEAAQLILDGQFLAVEGVESYAFGSNKTPLQGFQDFLLYAVEQSTYTTRKAVDLLFVLLETKLVFLSTKFRLDVFMNRSLVKDRNELIDTVISMYAKKFTVVEKHYKNTLADTEAFFRDNNDIPTFLVEYFNDIKKM